MTPAMAYAQRKIIVWELCKMWNCSPWELGKRPVREIREGIDYLVALSQVRELEAKAEESRQVGTERRVVAERSERW